MKLLKQNHIRYGLYGTLVLFFTLLVVHLSRYETFMQNTSMLQMVIIVLYPLLLWYFGIKAKKESQHGKLSFKEGFVEGFKIAVVFGIASPFAFLLYFLMFNFGTITGSDSPSFVFIAIDMIIQFLGSVIFGTIYGAIVSAVLSFTHYFKKGN